MFVITSGGVDVGAVYLGERDGDTWVELVEVLPDRQGEGIGTAVLRRVVRASGESGRGTRLQVHRVNVRAGRLYEREGFIVVGGTATHHLLRHGGKSSESC